MTQKRHCWKDEKEWLAKVYGEDSKKYLDAEKQGVSRVCMLEDGHDGPHEWTSYDDVVIYFKADGADGKE